MQENTNKAIAINSIISYGRLVVTAVCGLLTTRFALAALGVNDFGIFSVVGSIIVFISVINIIMLSTSNRFIAVAIGKGDTDEINQQFNVNLAIHAGIALIILIAAIPVGSWYINHFVNYDGGITNVKWVYNVTIIGSVIGILGVPYNGLLVAKERFLVFCLTDVVCHLIKMGAAYSLLFFFTNKLYAYTLILTSLSIIPTLVYWLYCSKVFPDLVRIKPVKDKSKYKAVFGFSVWVGYGAVATIGKAQGAALLVNAFFNTIMNTALGLANSVNSIMMTFAGNVTRAIAPQITKSYSAGNVDRSESLVCLASRISFSFMLLVSSPFLLSPELIFRLWLGTIPEYVVVFTQLLIIDALIGSLNAGIPDLIFATGKIKWYQLIVNTLFILSVVAAYFVLKAGTPAYYLIITYIVFSLIVLVVRQIVLNKVVHFNNWRLLRESYLPSFLIVLLFVPYYMFATGLNEWLRMILGIIYLVIIIWFIGIKKAERKKCLDYIAARIKVNK